MKNKNKAVLESAPIITEFPTSFGSLSELGLDMSDLDPDLVLIIKKTNKKDPQTKLRAAQELLDFIQKSDSESFLNHWASIYNKLGLDIDRRVRETMCLVHHHLMTTYKKKASPILKSVIATWLVLTVDPYQPVALKANETFDACFKSKPDVLNFCKSILQEYTLDILLNSTPQTLSDARYYSVEEMVSKHDRVMEGALHICTLLIEIDAAPSFLLEEKFYKLTSSDSNIRRAFYSFIHKNAQALSQEQLSASLLYNSFSEKEISIHSDLFTALLTVLKAFPDIWFIPTKKPLNGKLFHFLRNGCFNSKVAYASLLPFLSLIPQSVVLSDKFLVDFFENFWVGILSVDSKKNVVDAMLECLLFCMTRTWIPFRDELMPFLFRIIHHYLFPGKINFDALSVDAFWKHPIPQPTIDKLQVELDELITSVLRDRRVPEGFELKKVFAKRAATLPFTKQKIIPFLLENPKDMEALVANVAQDIRIDLDALCQFILQNITNEELLSTLVLLLERYPREHGIWEQISQIHFPPLIKELIQHFDLDFIDHYIVDCLEHKTEKDLVILYLLKKDLVDCEALEELDEYALSILCHLKGKQIFNSLYPLVAQMAVIDGNSFAKDSLVLCNDPSVIMSWLKMWKNTFKRCIGQPEQYLEIFKASISPDCYHLIDIFFDDMAEYARSMERADVSLFDLNPLYALTPTSILETRYDTEGLSLYARFAILLLELCQEGIYKNQFELIRFLMISKDLKSMCLDQVFYKGHSIDSFIDQLETVVAVPEKMITLKSTEFSSLMTLYFIASQSPNLYLEALAHENEPLVLVAALIDTLDINYLENLLQETPLENLLLIYILCKRVTPTDRIKRAVYDILNKEITDSVEPLIALSIFNLYSYDPQITFKFIHQKERSPYRLAQIYKALELYLEKEVNVDAAKIMNVLGDILVAPQSHVVVEIQRLLSQLLLDNDISLDYYPLLESYNHHLQIVAYKKLSSQVKLQTQNRSLIFETSGPTHVELDDPLVTGLEQLNLFSWALFFDCLQDSNFQLRMSYISLLRQQDCLDAFLSLIFSHLSVEKKPFNLDKWDITEFEYLGYDPTHSLKLLSAHLYWRCLLEMSSLTRLWFTECRNRSLSLNLEKFTETWFSPLLIKKEFQLVTDRKQEYPQLEIKMFGSNLTASFAVEDAVLEITFKLPGCYPLKSIEVEGGNGPKVVGVNEARWRAWLLAVTAILTAQNGTVSDALVLFHRNVTLHFEGIEDCAICYSIISPVDRCVPNKPCKTCKHLFHGSCLYKWFKSSNQNTCPLCRNIF